jgi:hypothetical protein
VTTIAQERAARVRVGLVMRLREQWGARFNYTTSRPVEEPATRLFWHITITNPSAYSSNDAHARAVENIGISRFPSTGISYNGLILPGGLLYEAQPFGRRGAHTVNDFQRSTCSTSGCPSRGSSLAAPSFNLNINSRALALARNTGDPVTDADVQAAARWGAGYKLAGMVHPAARWHGHRCVSAKSCPGDKAWTRIDDVADLTATYLRNGLPGTQPPGDDDMPSPTDWTAADWKIIRQNIGDEVWHRDVSPDSTVNPAWTTLWNIHQLLAEPVDLAAAIVAAMPPGSPVDVATVEQGVRNVLLNGAAQTP